MAGADGEGMTERLPSRVALRAAAEQVWQYLFDEPMPAQVKPRWRHSLGRAKGLGTVGAISGKGGTILLDYSYLKSHDPLATLVHEFAHNRGFASHNKRFYRHLNRWLRKLNLPEETP